MKHLTILFSVFLGLIFCGGFIPLAMAADPPPEFHIYSDGTVEIRSGTVESLYAANYYGIIVWGLTWSAMADYYTKLEAADGTPIKPEEIKEGHLLDIRGKQATKKKEFIDALFIRDVSIRPTGTFTVTILATTSPVSVPQTFSKPAQTPSLFVVLPPPIPLQTNGLLTASLYAGMRGREVIALQRFLQKNGWGIPDDGPVTGYFGKVTERAVINFQKANNLEPVGFVGPRTRALINSLLQK